MGTEYRESIQQWRKWSWRFCGLTQQKNQTSLPLPLNASTRIDWEGMSDGLSAKYREVEKKRGLMAVLYQVEAIKEELWPSLEELLLDSSQMS